MDPTGDDSRGGGTYRLKGQSGTGFVPERTALLVIDPVNDFLSEGGADWDMARRTVEKHDVVGHLKQAIEGARQRGSRCCSHRWRTPPRTTRTTSCSAEAASTG